MSNDTEVPAISATHAAELYRRADALLNQGTLVWSEHAPVAYAFVVPIEARDDLADIFGDIAFEAGCDVTHESRPPSRS